MDLIEIEKKISSASIPELELVWLPKIIENQTEGEMKKFATVLDNGIGLNRSDAPYATRLYYQVKSGKHLDNIQADRLRKMLPKYKRQYQHRHTIFHTHPISIHLSPKTNNIYTLSLF